MNLVTEHIESVSEILRERVLTDKAPLVGLFGRKYFGLGWIDGDWYFDVTMVSGKRHEIHSETKELSEAHRDSILSSIRTGKKVVE